MIAPMTKCKTPSRLFNELEDHFGVDSRAKVAHILKVSPQRMNQIRAGETPMSGNFIWRSMTRPAGASRRSVI